MPRPALDQPWYDRRYTHIYKDYYGTMYILFIAIVAEVCKYMYVYIKAGLQQKGEELILNMGSAMGLAGKAFNRELTYF